MPPATAKGQKNHYIPQFYLKQWIGADGRLCEFRREYGRVRHRRTYPAGTGYAHDLYTLNALPAAIATALENHFFRQTDGQAADALAQLLKGDVHLGQEKRTAWSRFIMTMIHRSPEGLARLAKLLQQEYPKLLDEVVEELPEEQRTQQDAVVAIERMRTEFSEANHQRMILHILQGVMDSDLVGTALNRMAATILRFDSHPLLTSDRPIIMTNGLNAPTSHLVIPISPRMAFASANDPDLLLSLHQGAATDGLAQVINHKVARASRRFVYGIDEEALPFLANRLGDCVQWSPFE
jgi:hypothetical protein